MEQFVTIQTCVFNFVIIQIEQQIFCIGSHYCHKGIAQNLIYIKEV